MRKIKLVFVIALVAVFFQLRAGALANIAIDAEEVSLKGYLKKEYKATSFNITNNSTDKILVYNVSFTGDRPSDGASQSVLDNSGNEVAVLWAVGLGLFWIFLIPLMIALIATPFVLISKGSKKKKTRLEANMLGEKGPREFEIKAGTQEELVGLFPKELTYTRLSFDYKDLSTGSISHFEEKFEF